MPPKSNKHQQQKGKASTPAPAPKPTVDLTNKLKYSSIPDDEAVARTIGGFDTLSAHSQFPHFIKLCHDDVRGRYVTAIKPIKAGVTILENKPWAYALNTDAQDKTCGNCNCNFTRQHQPIQCSKCNITLYCSRTCFNEHGSLHMNECESLTKLPDMKFEGDTVFLRLIIRALVVRQLQKAHENEVTTRVPILKRNKNLFPFKPQPNLPWEEISGLMTHEDKLPTATTTQISNIMKTLQHVLKLSWWDGEQSMYARYLYLILLINKFPIKDTVGRTVGHGLYLYPSYFNHSDSPNVVFEYGLNQKITIRALRDIAPGEELNHAYCELYEPSWQRRAHMRRLFHVDPYVLLGANSRSDPAVRVKDDFNIAGLKCVQCDGGVLNYHQVKNALQPGAIIATPAPVVVETDTTAQPEDKTVEGEVKPEAPVKEWLSLDKPTDCTVVTCYGCKATYPLTAADSWLQHIMAYFTTQRLAMTESMPKLLAAQHNFANIVSLISKPTAPLPKEEFDATIALYSDFQKVQSVVDASQTPPPALFRLSSTHSIVYKTYQSLLYASIQTFDVAAIHKYSQLLFICLSNPLYNIAMTDYYDILMHLGDSCAFLSGNYGSVTGATHVRAQMIVSPEIAKIQLAKAQDYYEKSIALRRIHYGRGISENPHILQVETRLRNLTALLPKKK